MTAGYLTVPGYAAFQGWLGRAAALGPRWEAWRVGDRSAAAAAVPDEVVDDLIVYGTAAGCAPKVRATTMLGWASRSS